MFKIVFFVMAHALLLPHHADATDTKKVAEILAPYTRGSLDHEEDEKFVASGHDFVGRLVCPDGGRAKVASIGSNKDNLGKWVDVYRLKCDDGTIGEIVWRKDQKAEPPAGFRLAPK